MNDDKLYNLEMYKVLKWVIAMETCRQRSIHETIGALKAIDGYYDQSSKTNDMTTVQK